MILFEHQVKPVANAGSVTHILYPHELFHMLFCRFPDSAKLYFGAEPSQLRKFWTQFLGTAYGREAADKLPALRNKAPSELDHCIPLIVHGDGCPVTKKSSAMFVQWGGLLGWLRSSMSAKLPETEVHPPAFARDDRPVYFPADTRGSGSGYGSGSEGAGTVSISTSLGSFGRYPGRTPRPSGSGYISAA